MRSAHFAFFPQVLLEPDPFLNELHKMFERSKGQGTLFITMKRSSMKPRRSKKGAPPPEAYKLLIRANDGKRHVSTTVTAAQHAKFASSVNVIMKAGMDGLKQPKKKEKKKE